MVCAGCILLEEDRERYLQMAGTRCSEKLEDLYEKNHRDHVDDCPMVWNEAKRTLLGQATNY